MKIAFRVDASIDIGIGHLMRCLALSEALRKRGHHCSFLSKTSTPEVIQRIEKFHCDFHGITPATTLSQDQNTFIEYCHKNDIDWVVTDHYALDLSYIKEIKHQGFHVLSIDDTAQMHYYSDIVVNQNIGAEKFIFSTEQYTTILRGPTYAMLRDELLQRGKKKHQSNVKKLLITLGGTDPENDILRISQSIAEVTTNLEQLLVIGPFNPHRAVLQSFAEKTDAPITLIQSPDNMADIYLQADLAISAGGSSCYELAYFGIPNLIVTIADNQLAIAHEFDRQHIGLYLGKKNEMQPEYLKDKLKELIENQLLRKRMSRNGQKLVDGKGKERIVDCMEKIFLKKTDSDGVPL